MSTRLSALPENIHHPTLLLCSDGTIPRVEWDGHCATWLGGRYLGARVLFSDSAPWSSPCPWSTPTWLLGSVHLGLLQVHGCPRSSASSIPTACTGLSLLTSLPHSAGLAGSSSTMWLLTAVCFSVPNHPEQNKSLPHFGPQRVSVCFMLSFGPVCWWEPSEVKHECSGLPWYPSYLVLIAISLNCISQLFASSPAPRTPHCHLYRGGRFAFISYPQVLNKIGPGVRWPQCKSGSVTWCHLISLSLSFLTCSVEMIIVSTSLDCWGYSMRNACTAFRTV